MKWTKITYIIIFSNEKTIFFSEMTLNTKQKKKKRKEKKNAAISK